MKIPETKERWDLYRDVLLFFFGLVGIFYELFSGVNNPSLLVVFAGMLGLPITLSHATSRTEK